MKILKQGHWIKQFLFNKPYKLISPLKVKHFSEILANSFFFASFLRSGLFSKLLFCSKVFTWLTGLNTLLMSKSICDWGTYCTRRTCFAYNNKACGHGADSKCLGLFFLSFSVLQRKHSDVKEQFFPCSMSICQTQIFQIIKRIKQFIKVRQEKAKVP